MRPSSKNRKLKVLHLFDVYLPPSQIWAFHLLRNLPEVEIHIGAEIFLRHNFFPAEFQYTAALRLAFNEFIPAVKYGSWQHLKLKIGQFLWPDADLAISYLKHYIKKHEIDIVHAHFGPVAWTYSKMAQQLPIAFAVSFYGYDYLKVGRRFPIYRNRYQQLFQRADLFLGEGPYAARKLQEIGAPAEKVRVSPLGIHVNELPVRQKTKKTHSLRLLQIAAFTEKKGQIYTVRAFVKALTKCPDMRLTLIGEDRDGKTQQLVRDLIEGEKFGDKIEVLDFVPYDSLVDHFRANDVFIHPSCHAADADCEGGAPVILFEALANGLPVISTLHCDIPTVVQDGLNGLLVAERDTEQLAVAIQDFYGMEEDVYQGFSRECRRFVERHFDIEKNAKILLQHYRELLLTSDKTI